MHGLLHSEIRMNRSLKAYEIQFSPAWAFQASDWQGVAELEAVLNATRITATLAQIERDYMAAYTCLIKTMALKILRADTMAVIELDKVAKSPICLRADIPVAQMLVIGQTARVRALLEGERRWCGNTTELLNDAPVLLGRHELLAMLLDKRTVGCHHVSIAQRQEAVVIFIAEYVKFYMQAAQWKADLIQQARVDAEAAALADDDDDDVVKKEGS